MEHVTNYSENAIRTYTGKSLDLKHLRQDMICIEDIVHGLSHTMRFAGQLDAPYSVLQHSVLVALNVSKENQLAALLHDASEAFLGDMPSPFKKMMPDYQKLEADLMQVIALKFGFDYPLPVEVKECDRHFLDVEWNALVLHKLPLEVWSPQQAKNEFYDLFYSITDHSDTSIVKAQIFKEHQYGESVMLPNVRCYKAEKVCTCTGLCRESV